MQFFTIFFTILTKVDPLKTVFAILNFQSFIYKKVVHLKTLRTRKCTSVTWISICTFLIKYSESVTWILATVYSSNNTLHKYLSYILEKKRVIAIKVCPISLRIKSCMASSYLSLKLNTWTQLQSSNVVSHWIRFIYTAFTSNIDAFIPQILCNTRNDICTDILIWSLLCFKVFSTKKIYENKRITSHNRLPCLHHVRLRFSFIFLSFGWLRRTDRQLSVPVTWVGRGTSLAKQLSCDKRWITPTVTLRLSFVLMIHRCNTSTANNRSIF